MKKIVSAFVVFLCSLSLIGCQNMSNQDAGVLTGAVAGGLLGSTIGKGGGQIMAIAAGSIAGALIGGAIGKNMDQNDRARMNNALEANPVGQPTYWTNADTGTAYEVKPVRNVTVGHNRYCREYQTTATINGKQQKMYGKACRQPDGSWKAVS